MAGWLARGSMAVASAALHAWLAGFVGLCSMLVGWLVGSMAGDDLCVGACTHLEQEFMALRIKKTVVVKERWPQSITGIEF